MPAEIDARHHLSTIGHRYILDVKTNFYVSLNNEVPKLEEKYVLYYTVTVVTVAKSVNLYFWPGSVECVLADVQGWGVTEFTVAEVAEVRILSNFNLTKLHFQLPQPC